MIGGNVHHLLVAVKVDVDWWIVAVAGLQTISTFHLNKVLKIQEDIVAEMKHVTGA